MLNYEEWYVANEDELIDYAQGVQNLDWNKLPDGWLKAQYEVYCVFHRSELPQL